MLVLLCFAAPLAAQEQQAKLAGSVITFEAAEPLTLATERVKVDRQKIEDLLEARGVKPAGGAYSLVYRLNPELSDLAKLKPGSIVALPKLKAWPVDGSFELVRLELDREKVAELDRQASEAVRLSDRLRASPPSDSPLFAAAARDIDAGARDLRHIATVLEANLVSVDPTFLADIRAEARLLNELSGLAAKGGGALSTEDARRLALLREDLSARAEVMAERKGPGDPPARYPEALVKVRTRYATGEDAPNLRVVYSAVVLCGREEPHPFDQLSTPTQKSIGEGHFRFWARNAKGEAVSAPHDTRIRRSEPPTIDLLVAGKPGESDAKHEDPCPRG